ncbi:MAG: endopeptidase La [Thermomicrobiales bacterium]
MRQHDDLPVSSGRMRGGRMPVLPLKNVVVFPRNVISMLLLRHRSIHAVEEAMLGNKMIAVTSYKDTGAEDPTAADLFRYGTLASILSVERQQDGNLQVVLEGIDRIELENVDLSRPFFMASSREIPEPSVDPVQVDVLIQHIQELSGRYADARGVLSVEVLDMIQRATHPGHLADLLATQLIDDFEKRQDLLATADPLARLERIGAYLSGELDVFALEQKIRDGVRAQMDEQQRRHYLMAQQEAIAKELGGDDADEFQTLRNKIKGRGLPAYVEEKLTREMARLERMPSVSAESTVSRTYIETMLALPWHEITDDSIDLLAAEAALGRDHYGLDAVKERIIEFLAVRKLTLQAGTQASAQILCLWGPPGVGKTSLGRSVAQAMGRKFVRVSLGGIRDEAEIRGHRRTYIGAQTGRIISAMKTAGTMNPVILLDEIDKLASDYRGDPTAAMLEVLDPEQNKSFVDHYLDVPYDLSQVLFITTANYAQQIPRPLRDRMEMIEVSAYTEDEKAEIASRHLLRRQISASAPQMADVEIDILTWKQLIRAYTREAGVRGLDREVANLGRKIATQIVRGKLDPSVPLVITPDTLEDFLGPKKYGTEQDLGGSQIGLAIGLGVTEIGGEIIPVEVATMSGHGSIRVTGQAGDVMQESAHAAISYARSRADELNIPRDFHERLDIHIHLAEAATPKDGPSAGITMATALISALTKRPVRSDTAMTGEIMLRGHVRPIGGLRDKALAAHRHGYRRLIAPKDNQQDLRDIPQNIRDEMEFFFVSTMDQVIREAILLDEQQEDQLEDVTSFKATLPIQPDVIDAQGRH